MKKANVISSDVFIRSKGQGNVYAQSFYTGKSGLDLISFHAYETISDVLNISFVRYSQDNGRTWSEPVEWKTMEKYKDGWILRSFSCGYADPSDRFLVFVSEGIYPAPKLVRGNRFRSIRYMASGDGGRTFRVNAPVIHKGEEFDTIHPLPHIWIGKNECAIGDMGCCPISLKDGTILMPFQFSRLNNKGELFCPHEGTDHFWSSAVLLGQWTSDGELEWEMSQPLWGDSEKVTMGLFEPTIAKVDDGQVLMILRGSNRGRPNLPAHKWMTISRDGGRTWPEPVPWTYEDGSLFFSPSSMSQLLHLSNGRLVWIGNISEKNCNGNEPRYPLVFGEVDLKTGLLIRDSVSIIDTRGEEDHPEMSLSNFHAREDRETGDVILHMWRYAINGAADDPNNYSDSLIYRIDPGRPQ